MSLVQDDDAEIDERQRDEERHVLLLDGVVDQPPLKVDRRHVDGGDGQRHQAGEELVPARHAHDIAPDGACRRVVACLRNGPWFGIEVHFENDAGPAELELRCPGTRLLQPPGKPASLHREHLPSVVDGQLRHYIDLRKVRIHGFRQWRFTYGQFCRDDNDRCGRRSRQVDRRQCRRRGEGHPRRRSRRADAPAWSIRSTS